MGRKYYLTVNRSKVLKAISDGHNFGYAIRRYAGLSETRTAYDALYSLEAAGLLMSEQEDVALAHAQGRPARVYYHLTPEGRQTLEEARKKFAKTLEEAPKKLAATLAKLSPFLEH